MIYAPPGGTFEAVADNAPTGLVGTIGVRVIDGQGTTTVTRTTTGIVESPAGSGIYTATLTAPSTGGQYSIVWDTGGGSPTFASEALTVTGTAPATPTPTGTPYFTVAEARAVKPLEKTSYTDAEIEAARAWAEEALERACRVAFTPRTTTETLDGPGGTDLLLPNPRPIAVTACTVDGTALDADALAGLVVYRDGRVYRECGWTCGRGNVVVTFNHGHETVPGFVKQAAIKLTKWLLVDSPVSSQTTVMSNEDGTTQFFGGQKADEPFAVAECNAVVRQYGYAGDVA